MTNSKSKSKGWKIIFKRELKSYFSSLIPYIVCVFFLITAGFIFFSTFFAANRAELRYFFEWLPILFSFIIPALAMRTFSEEKKSGSFETLVTLPVSTGDIVAGKYLALLLSTLLLLVPTFFYIIACCIVGNPDPGPLVGGYLGAVFLAAAFSAIGLFASSVTKNQIVAFFLSAAICLVLTILDYFAQLIPGAVYSVISFFSARSHFMSVSRGIIDTRDVIYFLSVTVLFIAATVRVLKNDKRG